MRKKLVPLLGIMIILVIVGGFMISMFGRKEESDEKKDTIKVVTSFYPSFIIGLNIADQINGIEVDSLTNYSVGCLHDYQLTTEDMKQLSTADVFLMNGGGMESYLEDVVKNYPELTIVDISKGITMLESDEQENGLNPHVWLDPSLYKAQIVNVKEGLEQYIKNNASANPEVMNDMMEKINSNTEIYLQKITELEGEFDVLMQGLQDKIEAAQSNKVVIFHDSFAYLAERAGLEVAYTVEIEGDTALNAGEIADVIDLVNKDMVKYLFTEKQYGDSITDRVKEETDAEVYIIDSAVTGDGTKESYLKSMNQNLLTLKAAFQ